MKDPIHIAGTTTLKTRETVNAGIQLWLKSGDNSGLQEALPILEELWRAWSLQENDYRTGVETYGYDDPETVRNTMEYISDRWYCSYRVKWIIDGLKAGHI